VLRHCWLGHVTRKIVSEMTCVEWDVKYYYTITGNTPCMRFKWNCSW